MIYLGPKIPANAIYHFWSYEWWYIQTIGKPTQLLLHKCREQVPRDSRYLIQINTESPRLPHCTVSALLTATNTDCPVPTNSHRKPQTYLRATPSLSTLPSMEVGASLVLSQRLFGKYVEAFNVPWALANRQNALRSDGLETRHSITLTARVPTVLCTTTLTFGWYMINKHRAIFLQFNCAQCSPLISLKRLSLSTSKY